MKAETKTKISNIFWPIAYFGLAVALVASICVAIGKVGYVRIYVSGTSMEPTLHGGNGGSATTGDIVDFGSMDPSAQAINNLKRFNIVTTYFPYGWTHSDYYKDPSTGEIRLIENPSYKIKRLIGFPGEIVNLSVDVSGTCHFTITSSSNSTVYTYVDNVGWQYKVDDVVKTVNYQIKHNGVDSLTASKNHTFTLAADEYFVMGDNWNVSSDSSVNRLTCTEYIKKEQLQGLLVSIDGEATVVSEGGKISLTNLQYKDKKYYYMEL